MNSVKNRILLGVIILALSTSLFIFLKKIIQKEIQKEVATLTQGLLSVENVDVNYWSLFSFLRKKESVPRFDISLSGLRYVFPDSLYYLTLDKLEYQWKDSLVSFQGLKYKSFVPQYEFAYHDPKHSDWMDLEAGSLRIENLSVTELLYNKSILADRISLDNIVFRNYKNQQIPIEHHVMPVIYEQIQGIPYAFQIKEVLINNLAVHYQELAKDGINPGEIFFTHMQIESRNFTNRGKAPDQMNRLDFSGKLMGEGDIKSQLYFPVDTLYDHVKIQGTLGPMAMISLNKIIEPLLFVRIKDGTIQGMDFTITGGKEKAHINMCLLYQDLSVEVLKQNDEHEVHKNILLSVLADHLIHKSNPKNDDPPRRVSAEYARDPLHSSFNYLWKIHYAGLIETLGYTKSIQKNVDWVKEEIGKIKDL